MAKQSRRASNADFVLFALQPKASWRRVEVWRFSRREPLKAGDVHKVLVCVLSRLLCMLIYMRTVRWQ